MAKSGKQYTIRRYPLQRRLIIDSGTIRRKQAMVGLVEFDVTEARRVIRAHKAATGETLSFTAFMVHCLARAVDEHKMVHAYRNWLYQLVIFEDVDINTIIEIDLAGRKFPMVHVIRAANKRSLQEIHEDLRAAQTNPKQSPVMRHLSVPAKVFLLLPGRIRRMFYRLVAMRPAWYRSFVGTVGVTSVGMFGAGGGWGINVPLHTLSVVLGGIDEKPTVVDGEVAIREMVSVTLNFDHEIIDGAPAARFTQRFKELVEGCYGLEHPLVDKSSE